MKEPFQFIFGIMDWTTSFFILTNFEPEINGFS